MIHYYSPETGNDLGGQYYRYGAIAIQQCPYTVSRDEICSGCALASGEASILQVVTQSRASWAYDFPLISIDGSSLLSDCPIMVTQLAPAYENSIYQ